MKEHCRDHSGLWIDAISPHDWEQAVTSYCRSLLGPVFAEGGSVTLKSPDAQNAKKAVTANQDLFGEIVVAHSGIFDSPLRLQVPLPYNGVFVKRSEKTATAGLAVWCSWLGELPEFRYLRKPGDNETVFWRMGIPGGGYVQARCGDLNDDQRKRAFPKRLRIPPPRSAWPQFLHGLYDQQGLIDLPLKGKEAQHSGFWEQVHDLATNHLRAGRATLTDEDDLNYRALVTFPVWLKARLAEALVTTFLEISGSDAATLVYAFRENKPVNNELAKDLWEKLIEDKQADALAMRLRPPGWSRGQAADGTKRFCPLQWIDPVNPVDLAALLTQVRRYPLAHEVLGKLPAHYRQNHPSFRGRICPVQSPESELVGLSLHLSRGAKVDWEGRITPADSSRPHEELGLGAGLVPFYEHNDGARCMMGAKNLRQAVPVTKRHSPAVKTGGEALIREFAKPLIECGVCSDASDGDGKLALGVDLLVGYLPWQGMNVDDAIVVGRHVVDEGLLDIELEERVRQQQKPGWVATSLGKSSLFSGRTILDKLFISPEEIDGLALEGTELFGGSLIAAFGIEGREDRTVKEVRYLDRSPATLKSIRFRQGAPWMGGVLEYELIKKLKLGLGDKLMGRHGNKGVIGAILPSSQMPRLPDDATIPAHLRGKPIDILLNPHGVISRMNLGQLLETHIGWLLRAGYKQEQFMQPGISANAQLGQPFLNALDHTKVQTLLKESGLDRFGRIQLILPDGTQTRSPIVVGYQYIVRLKQIPELKSQARRGGVGAVYSRSTGQAIHGRIIGGGQRVGEMEVWALAGHQADYILEELLGVKADSVLTRRMIESGQQDSKDIFDGFATRLKDWLFALLIDLRIEGDKTKLAFADPEAARKRIGETKRVENSNVLKDMVQARFSCQSNKKGGCPFDLLDGACIASEQPAGTIKQVSLKLDELLEHLGLAAGTVLLKKRGDYFLQLRSIRDGHPSGQFNVSFDSGKTQVKATIQADSKHSAPGWPASLNGLPLCGQFSAEKGRNADVTLVLQEFLKEDGRWRFGQLSVACPKHPTIPLKAKPPFAHVHKPVPGGLFDTGLFGQIASAGTTDDGKHWAYIELPVTVPYPVKSFLGPKEGTDDFLDRHNIRAETFPSIKVVPVLPLRYRMPLLQAETTQQDQLLRDGYIPLINACRQHEAAKDDKQRQAAARNLHQSVTDLFRLLVTHLTDKEGLIRHAGLGRRVDRSARLVVVPNPQLRWDEAGVPTAVLLELLGDELTRWVREKRESGDLSEIISVMTAKREDADLMAEWSWRKSAKNQSLLEEGHKLLCRFLDAHPDVLVILNRQPSLHRDSVQAFRPVPLSPHAGDVLQICPLVCKGFGADFDGDEMAIHLPISVEAREEAKRLLPSQNMFSLATGKVLASYEQDFVLGMYWLSRKESGFKQRLLSELPGDCCRKWVNKTVVDQDAGSELLQHLALAHSHQEPYEIIWRLSNLAYDCCSHIGVSFGFYELSELSNRCAEETRKELKKFDSSEPEEINAKLNKIVQQPLNDVTKNGDDLFGRPALHFAAMALSGARGKQQVRQLIASRGFLAPGVFAPSESFLIASSLVHGMFPEEAFFAAMNARSSMCDKKLGTRQAGYLTRRLVTALWPIRIVEKDCGDTTYLRNPVACRSHKDICAACYGALPDGASPPIGFPAGLIAAQSIGERGTQLSMQSFHTGEKAFTIQTVLEILDGNEQPQQFFDHPESAKEFVAAMMKSKPGEKSKPYRDLNERHFQILWRAIHNSPKKTLRSATQAVGLITRISFEQQGKNILIGTCSDEHGSMDEPFARVLFNLFGTRCQPKQAKPA